MIVYDCLYPSDRPFLPRKPLEGCKDVLVDGQRFYAIKPNTGGARDLSRYDPAEARKWPLPTEEMNKPAHQPHLENFFNAVRSKEIGRAHV